MFEVFIELRTSNFELFFFLPLFFPKAIISFPDRKTQRRNITS